MQLNPSLLIKKDRGRQHVDSKARPKAYGEVDVLSNVPGLDLLKHDDDNGESDDDDDDEPSVRGTDEMVASSDDEGLQITNTDSGSEDDNMISEDGDEIDENDSDVSGDEDEVEAEDEDEDEDEEENTEDEEEEFDNNDAKDGGSGVKENIAKKRKFADFDTQLNDAEASLRTLKRLAKENMGPAPSDSTDGFLSNEDFRRIKELKVCQE